MTDSKDAEPYATDDPTQTSAAEQETLTLEAVKKFRMLGPSDTVCDKTPPDDDSDGQKNGGSDDSM